MRGTTAWIFGKSVWNGNEQVGLGFCHRGYTFDPNPALPVWFLDDEDKYNKQQTKVYAAVAVYAPKLRPEIPISKEQFNQSGPEHEITAFSTRVVSCRRFPHSLPRFRQRLAEINRRLLPHSDGSWLRLPYVGISWQILTCLLLERPIRKVAEAGTPSRTAPRQVLTHWSQARARKKKRMAKKLEKPFA